MIRSVRYDGRVWIVAAWFHRQWERGYIHWKPEVGGGYSVYLGWLTVSWERRRP